MVVGIKFYLFSKIEFEIPDPVTLIGCYCYQSDFYKNLWYSLVVLFESRKIKELKKDKVDFDSMIWIKLKIVVFIWNITAKTWKKY